MAYPAPDRSDHVANRMGQQFVDIGWREGTLSDGRPYRAEGWYEEEIVTLSIFLSTQGLENTTVEQLTELAEREGLIEFAYEERPVALRQLVDRSGNELWVLDVTVDDDGWSYVRGGAALHLLPYPDDSMPEAVRMPAPSPERQRRLQAMGILPSSGGTATALTLPKPDRSNRVKRSSNESFDVGWNEGLLSDGRPFRSEYWVERGISKLTIFLPVQGIEGMSAGELTALLEREGVLEFAPGAEREVSAERMTDAAGNEVWALQVVVGADDNNLAVRGGSATVIRPYIGR
jgi:hypothetical protein